jgi:6-phosphofructo-2-kinase/fructose-2,6-biphosphatase 2
MEKINYKIIIVFVGLPASGKSYTSFHIKQYLTWLGYNIQIFNCGNYRRKISGGGQDSSFFDNSNKENLKSRELYFNSTMFDLNTFLNLKNGDIGILDATNSTKERREKIINFFSNLYYEKKIIFLENITTDKEIIEQNILFKSNSPDYNNFSLEDMKSDFKKRLNYYEKRYDTISDEEKINYVKIYDCGSKVTFSNIYGYIETLLLNFLVNFRVSQKKIYISRHGESLYNLESRIGGDPDLTEEGYKYADKLYKHISLHYKKDDIIIFTSNLNRTKMTAKWFIKNGYNVKHREILNEIDGGICEHMTYEDIQKKMPRIFDERKKDKFLFKYPEGESYADLIIRLKEFILEINRIEKPILIICHNAIVRTIYSYYLNIPHKEIPYLDIPLHKLNCIENDKYFYSKKNIL